jgi:SP family general alpha glucoside:H+ symporter-like MFS transporter
MSGDSSSKLEADLGFGNNAIVSTATNTSNKWRRLLSMKQFSAWMLYATLGVVMLGFDFSAYPQLLAVPSFAQRFGHFDEKSQTYIVSSGVQAAWNASSSAAQLVGGLFSGFAMDRLGRKWWLLGMNCLTILSIGVVYQSKNWKVLTGARVLQGVYFGCFRSFVSGLYCMLR